MSSYNVLVYVRPGLSILGNVISCYARLGHDNSG